VLSAEEARCWAEGEEGGDGCVVTEEGDHAGGESGETRGVMRSESVRMETHDGKLLFFLRISHIYIPAACYLPFLHY
jgi:hypothetical protein